MSQRDGVANMREVPEETWEEGRFGGRDQDLGGAAGSVAVGLRRTVLPPGKQSFPRHAHMAEEQIFFVVRGRGTLLRGEESVAVEAGDVAAFPAGTGVAHAFVADPGEDLEYLSIGERDDNDVVLYPDSGKLLVVGLADESGERRDRLGRLQEADYFDGELQTLGTTVRAIREEDHGTVVPLVNEWWGGRDMAWLLPRLFFQHFGDTSFAVEEGGELVAFLIGFVSQAKEGEAYVHFVGVSPERRETGVGGRLYGLFFEEVKKRGCRRVSCITSPVNEASIAFHKAMGFSPKASDGGGAEVGGVPVHEGHDGPGEDRVVFERALP